MKNRILVLVVLIAVAVSTLAWGQSQKALTNKDVSDMVKQGMNEALIIKVIQASDTNFDTSADAVAQLKSDGVSQNVLDTMAKAISNKPVAAANQATGNSNVPAGAAPVASIAPAPQPAPVQQMAPPVSLAPAPAAEANNGKYLLAEGTEVPLKFANDLSSKTAADGDTVELTLDSDLKIGDVTVAKAGSRAVAVVANAKKAGMMGRPGELNIQLQHLTAGGTRIHVRGTKGREGDSKTGTAVALTVLFGPIGLIKHGKNVEVKAGTALTAFVDQDTWLPPAS